MEPTKIGLISIRTYEEVSNPQPKQEKRLHNQVWLPAVALATALYLMYSPVFLTDYLMNDEWEFIGVQQGLRRGFISAFFFWGRSLFGFYSTLVYRFAGYNPFRVQMVRFLNFASLVVIALLLFVFLAKQSKSVWLSFFVTLFLFSTASMQELMAYSLQLIANTQPAMWFSLLALYFYFFTDDRRFSKSIRVGAAFLLLILAMQSTQTFAFFCLVPLTYVTLSDWHNQRRKITEFVSLALAVSVISSLAYRVGLHYWHARGFHGYKLGEQAMAAGAQHPFQVAIHAVNPLTYWSAFEIWSYPFPFNIVPSMTLKLGVALFLMCLWALIFVGAAFLEGRRDIRKWLAILVYLGFGAIFIVADSPLTTIEHRPHMVLTFTGVVIVSAAYSLQVLAGRYPSLGGVVPRALAVIFLALIVFGAQAGTLNAYVNDRRDLLDFIRIAVRSQEPSSYHNVVVILPESHGVEPREFWVGRGFQDRYHMTREAAYRYALATVGIPPYSKTITFMEDEPKNMPADSVIVDWKKYLLVRRARP